MNLNVDICRVRLIDVDLSHEQIFLANYEITG